MAVSTSDTYYTVKFPFSGLVADLLVCALHEGVMRKLKVKFVVFAPLVAPDCIALCLSGHDNFALSSRLGLGENKFFLS